MPTFDFKRNTKIRLETVDYTSNEVHLIHVSNISFSQDISSINSDRFYLDRSNNTQLNVVTNYMPLEATVSLYLKANSTTEVGQERIFWDMWTFNSAGASNDAWTFNNSIVKRYTDKSTVGTVEELNRFNIYIDTENTSKYYKLSNCRITDININSNIDDLVKMTVKIQGEQLSFSSSLPTTTIDKTATGDYISGKTVEGTDIGIATSQALTGFSINLANKGTWLTRNYISSGTTSVAYPDYFSYEGKEVTGNFSLYTKDLAAGDIFPAGYKENDQIIISISPYQFTLTPVLLEKEIRTESIFSTNVDFRVVNGTTTNVLIDV